MRKLLIALLLLLPVILTSCDDTIPQNGRTIFISVASDYMDKNINRLPNTLNDQAALAAQIETLTDGNVELHLYRSEEGKRYTSKDVSSTKDLFEYGIENLVDNPAGTKEKKKIKSKLKNWEILPEFTLQTVTEDIMNLNAGKNDLIIFHYSGHGVSPDGTLALDDKATEDMLGDANLISLMTNYNKDAKKLILLDSCFSGSFIKDSILSTSNNFQIVGSDEEYKNESIFKAIAGAFNSVTGKDCYGTPDIYIMAAATKSQSASDYSQYSQDRNHENFGAFSFFLLRALGFDTDTLLPKKVDYSITFYSLFNDVWSSFPRFDKEQYTPQATIVPMDMVLF